DILVVVVADAGRMRHEHPQGYHSAGDVRVAKVPAKIGRGVAVELQLALLDQLHDADGNDQLADRGDSHRIVGRDPAAGLGIGDTVSETRKLAIAVEGNADLRSDGRLGWRNRGAAGEEEGQSEYCDAHGAQPNRDRPAMTSRER